VYANSQSLAYVYSRQIVNTLTEDEARRIAVNIAKLPMTTRRSKKMFDVVKELIWQAAPRHDLSAICRRMMCE
jgi:hypothetical protein